jgi:hypothetical protein
MRKRAVDAKDAAMSAAKLPHLYQTLVPLSHERHGDLSLTQTRDFGFAAKANAIPLMADEFAIAMRDYPIVFTTGDRAMPVALTGFVNGVNSHVNADGSWSASTYVPAYLRRYPFALLRESETSDRNILCADLSSTQFAQDGSGEALFEGDTPTKALSGVLDFSKRFEESMARTDALMKDLIAHELVAEASVKIKRGEEELTVQGFSTVAEEKVRAMDDAGLADLARRGILTLVSAHQLSLAHFTSFGANS